MVVLAGIYPASRKFLGDFLHSMYFSWFFIKFDVVNFMTVLTSNVVNVLTILTLSVVKSLAFLDLKFVNFGPLPTFDVANVLSSLYTVFVNFLGSSYARC